jgi:hypothetical protein
MIFNAILGLSGLVLLGGGITAAVMRPESSSTDGNIANKIYIALIIIGAYITLLFFLGACSWRKSGVLIAYFILLLFLLIAELAVIVVFKMALDEAYKKVPSDKKTAFELVYNITIITLSVSLGISFLSFLCSTIYFCVMKRQDDPGLYNDVRKMEQLTTMPQ